MYLCFEVRSLLTLDVNLKLFWYKEQTCRLKKREKLDQQKIITKSKVIAVGVAVAQVDMSNILISIIFPISKCIHVL